MLQTGMIRTGEHQVILSGIVVHIHDQIESQIESIRNFHVPKVVMFWSGNFCQVGTVNGEFQQGTYPVFVGQHKLVSMMHLEHFLTFGCAQKAIIVWLAMDAANQE